jgi:probable phosphoglycerate mutase
MKSTHYIRPVAYFVRHGETDLNDENVFRGDLDVSLNEEGKKQAQEIVKFFKSKDLARIYGSDRKRVVETLAPLAKAKKMKIVVLNDLESLNTGDFSGKPKSKENLKAIKWYNEHPEVMIPGGETVRGFRERVDPVLMKTIHVGDDNGIPTVVGVHGSVLKELYRMLYGTIESKARVEPGGIVAIFKGSHGYEAIPVLGEKDREDIRPGS